MRYVNTLIASCLVAGSTLALAEIEWFTPQASDLHADQLTAEGFAIPPSLHQESAPVQFSWPRERASKSYKFAAGPTETERKPNVRSQQYWVDATGGELAVGVALPLTAPGAVIRISALDHDTRLILDPQLLELELNGQPITATPGAGGIVTGTELRQQGMPVPEDTLALDLGDQLGAGWLQIRHRGIRDDLPVVINVYEPNSPWIATLALQRHNYLAGQSLDFDFGLDDGYEQVEVRSIQAVVASPDAGQAWPIETGQHRRLTLASAPLAQTDRVTPGLYEAHVYLETEHQGLTIRRDMTLAFNIAPPIARFDQAIRRTSTDGLDLVLGVETAVAGRYQVNAEVLGSNAQGELEPLGFVQSAAVLEAGKGEIELALDPGMVQASGLSAPFELRNLQLLDQGRMYLLEQRARALRIHH